MTSGSACYVTQFGVNLFGDPLSHFIWMVSSVTELCTFALHGVQQVSVADTSTPHLNLFHSMLDAFSRTDNKFLELSVFLLACNVEDPGDVTTSKVVYHLLLMAMHHLVTNR
jgi:hypothetical protein